MKIAICSSMAFAKEIIQTKKELEKLGHKVTIPANTEMHTEGKIKDENKWEKVYWEVFKGYFKVIKKNDAILVLNHDKNGIKGYIGGNSLIEMSFAYVLDKKIFLLKEIPKLNYTEEIKAMKPVLINNNLKKIK
jgi:hypothetical protein